MADYAAHENLHLPRKGALQRYSKIFIIFGLSGAMHVIADRGGGLTVSRSGAMQFLLMQAIRIMIEDGVQVIWKRMAGDARGHSPGVARWEKTVGYI